LLGITREVNGETHLRDISLSFAPASFTTLLGRTGAGKTSLLRLMAGLDRPSRGRIHWNGEDITGRAVRTRDVAMVYQQFVNYPSLTVYDNIASPLRAKGGISRDEIDQRVREAARLLRLDRLLDRLPAALSGGQQQRTAIARALVKRSGLLLLDEPLANLDYKLREELRSELRTLFQSSEAVVVYATTEPSEALLLGGQTAVLHEGGLLQYGAARALYDAPAHERVARIFSDPELHLLPAELTTERRFVVGAGLAFPAPASCATLPAGRYRLGVRAHHVRLQARTADDVQLAATLRSLEVSGSDTVLHLESEGHALVAQTSGVHRFELGAQVTLYVSPERLFVFDEQGSLARAAPRVVEERHDGD
jgi:glycerol transport system ATP-binding protein